MPTKEEQAQINIEETFTRMAKEFDAINETIGEIQDRLGPEEEESDRTMQEVLDQLVADVAKLCLEVDALKGK